MDPFVGVWGDFPSSPGPLGWMLGGDAGVQQTLLQQQDPRWLLETHQACGADGRWVQVLQLPVLVAHFLRDKDGHRKKGEVVLEINFKGIYTLSYLRIVFN